MSPQDSDPVPVPGLPGGAGEPASRPETSASAPAPSSDTSPAASIPASIPASAPESGDVPPAEAPTETPAGEEGLPEWEPLSPEIVEDEAIRGDFMLRTAAILLAVLLGWTHIANTAALVRIRTGEYIASHGFLPPRTDVFSSTAADHRWINLGWLGDLVLASAYQAGGGVGLTILGALLAGVAGWILSRISRVGVSTWWGSSCGVLALLAAFPLLTSGPTAFTVIGAAGALYLLHRWYEQPQSRIVWALVPWMWLWANVDAHAFVGAAVLSLYGVGRLLSGGEGTEEGRTAGSVLRPIAVALAVMAIHPFHYHVWTSGWEFLSVVQPEHQAYSLSHLEFPALYLPVHGDEFWGKVDVFGVAALVIAAAALTTLLLNSARADWGHVVVFIGINGLAVFSGLALAAAAVVNAAIATLNAQDWYRATFRQTYSIALSELLFTRGGRAVTVFAFFGLAYLTISGHLMGPQGRRIGLGFQPALALAIEGYRPALEGIQGEGMRGHPFPFRPDQGDMLIWLGVRPFVDSRMRMYAEGDANLLQLHRDVRVALLPASNVVGSNRPDVWKGAFDKYDTTCVLPRLSGARPDYVTLNGMLSNNDFRLTAIEASTAVFHRVDVNVDSVPPAIDFVSLAFRGEPESGDPVGTPRNAWPRGPTFYEKYLLLPDGHSPNPLQRARHYEHLLVSLSRALPPTMTTALSCLVLRDARQSLLLDPNNVEAYRVMSGAYVQLGNQERSLMAAYSQPMTESLRDLQALQTLYHGERCAPDDPGLQAALFTTLLRLGHVDLAREHLLRFEEIAGQLSLAPRDDPGFEAAEDERRQLLERLTQVVDEVRQRASGDVLETAAPFENRLQFAIDSGCPGEALKLIERDATVIANDPGIQLSMARLLLLSGRMEEAWDLLEGGSEQLAQLPPDLQTAWRSLQGLANLAADDLPKAVDLWGEEADQQEQSRMTSVLATAPLMQSPPPMYKSWPLLRSLVLGDLLNRFPIIWGQLRIQQALVAVESGVRSDAETRLRMLIAGDPDCPYRPIAAYYLSLISGEDLSPRPASDVIPVTPDMFAAEPAATPATEAKGSENDNE